MWRIVQRTEVKKTRKSENRRDASKDGNQVSGMPKEMNKNKMNRKRHWVVNPIVLRLVSRIMLFRENGRMLQRGNLKASHELLPSLGRLRAKATWLHTSTYIWNLLIIVNLDLKSWWSIRRSWNAMTYHACNRIISISSCFFSFQPRRARVAMHTAPDKHRIAAGDSNLFTNPPRLVVVRSACRWQKRSSASELGSGNSLAFWWILTDQNVVRLQERSTLWSIRWEIC